MLTTVHGAEPEPEPVSLLPDFVVETRSFKPPGSSKPGAMMFPPEPIRLLEVKTRQSRALQSAICANRRRPSLVAERTVKIVLSDSLFVSMTRTTNAPQDPNPVDQAR